MTLTPHLISLSIRKLLRVTAPTDAAMIMTTKITPATDVNLHSHVLEASVQKK